MPTQTSDAALPRHPLNQGFTWTDHTGPYRRLTDEQVRAFDEDGFVVLPDAVPPGELAQVIADIDPLEQQLEDLLRQVEGGRVSIARADEITFTTHIVEHSPFIRQWVGSELFRDLCADLVGPDVRLYWDQAVYKKPDTASPFPWHQDNGYTFLEPQPYLTCWIALTDATEQNGCPWIVPGLHRQGTLAHRNSKLGYVCLEDPAGAVPVEASAGSIVVFSSLTPHCTGPNTSDGVRKAYIIQYAPFGAVALAAEDDGTVSRTPAAHPTRQYPILEHGAPVTIPVA